ARETPQMALSLALQVLVKVAFFLLRDSGDGFHHVNEQHLALASLGQLRGHAQRSRVLVAHVQRNENSIEHYGLLNPFRFSTAWEVLDAFPAIHKPIASDPSNIPAAGGWRLGGCPIAETEVDRPRVRFQLLGLVPRPRQTRKVRQRQRDRGKPRRW